MDHEVFAFFTTPLNVEVAAVHMKATPVILIKPEDRISMAVAGFSQDEIEIIQEGMSLVVTGRKDAPQNDKRMLHRGIANRSFKQVFSLAGHVKVAGANLENGLLAIELVREVPEQLKPRRIEIGNGGLSIGQTQPQKQIETETQAMAA